MAGRGVVVISGAGSGIGKATALHLCREGYTVVPGVRRAEQMDELIHDAGDSMLMRPQVFDVTSEEQVAAAVDAVRDLGMPLRAVVSNAGIDRTTGDLSAEGTSISDLDRLMQVNYLGAARFIQAFLPPLRQARGTVVINSAMMARIVLPFNGGYAPSKAALESWAIALRREIAPHGVKVVLVELGGVATPLLTKTGEPEAPNPLYPQQIAITREFAKMAESGADSPKTSPERVAELVAKAVGSQRPKLRYIGGGGGHFLATIAELPQRVQDAAIAQMLKRGS